MKKKLFALISCAVLCTTACLSLPACKDEEIDVESQAIIGNWLCTDIPTEGMTTDQAASFENYYMYLNVSAYEVFTLDADDSEIRVSYVLTYQGEEYTDIETDNEGAYYITSLGIWVMGTEYDSIEITEYIICSGKTYYDDYYLVYDDSGEIESYRIYNEITDSTKEENIKLRIDAYVTSEYYKDSSTTFTTLAIDKNNSKYSSDEELFLRFNAGTEESYVFEMDGDNKLTMTSPSSIYSFTFNRTETTYTSFCANYDYSSLHIRNEAVVGSWINRDNGLGYELFIEIGASDKDTLYIRSVIYNTMDIVESVGTIEIERSNLSYTVSDLYLNPVYGSASNYSITVVNDGSIFVESTVTGETVYDGKSFSFPFNPISVSYDELIEDIG